MKLSRRSFLQLSTLACAWLFTGCTTDERKVFLEGASDSFTEPQNTSGVLQNGIEDSNQVTTFPVRSEFELPLAGATGFVGSMILPLLAEAHDGADVLRMLCVGDMFYIRKEAGNYWQVCIADGTIGWLSSAFCMVNLPDVLPSILYENPNAVSAAFVTCGQPLDGITGYKLYDALYENPRLGRSEFVMPLNYNMAKKVGVAQQAALAQGDCIKMIESYRPYDVQVKVREALYAKERSNREIKTALNAGSWNTGWFIASTLSNHQRGVAVDVTLVRAEQMEQQQLVGCPFVRVTGNDYEMPSVIHELSSAAACFSEPVTSNSKTAWKKAEPAPGMTEGAFRLQKYCTDADLTPLASEWWHFNDLDAQDRVSGSSGRGGFRIEGCLSWKMFDA